MQFLLLISLILLFCIFIIFIFIYLELIRKEKFTSSQYKLTFDYSGNNLEKMNPNNSDSDWKFSPSHNDQFDGEPTHGIVQYGNNYELISIINQNNKKQLKIDLEHKSVNYQYRKAPRIHFYRKTFDHGLFIIDLEHLPYGPGLWPSFWFHGLTNSPSKWACNGEIDVIEGITDNTGKSTTNYSTLHTNIVNGNDCIQNIPNISNKSCSAGDIGYNSCGCSGNDNCPNLGCGIYWKNFNTFGNQFNDAKGGTFAIEISNDLGITIWFWPRNDPLLPDNIKNSHSDSLSTDNWQTQKDNKIQFQPCPNHFKNLVPIINTTLCGDWAGNVFFPNDPESNIKCQGYAQDPNVDITEGYWLINYVKIYE